MAAYYYLPRTPNEKSSRTVRLDSGLIVDLSKDGRPIGIEITAPNRLSLAALNCVLEEYGFQPLTRADLKPLKAA